jgi:signal transduction histidine kinase
VYARIAERAPTTIGWQAKLRLMNETLSLLTDSPVVAKPGPDDMAEVWGEQVRLVFSNLPLSQAVAFLNGGVLAIVLAFVVDRTAVLGWLAVLVLVTLGRMALAVCFERASPSTEAMPAWRGYFMVGAVASGLVWGSTAVVLYPSDSIIHQVFNTFVLGGMVIGAVAALTPMFSAFVLFAACALLPTIGRYLLSGNYVHLAMAGMGTVFLVAMLILGKRIHNSTMESLKLRFENQGLVAFLTRSQKHLVSTNADLLATQEKLTKANEALESRVAERTAALEGADRRKDEFLAVLSHELRNPLAPILNSIYILNHADAASEKAQHAREIIERQTRHITRLVDDLLDVTRIARGKIELRRERVDLTELLRRTVEDYASVFHEYGIEVLTRLPRHAVEVRVDATRIAQLIGNLLQNAAKFTPSGGEVVVSLEVAETCAEIRVADTGAGITPELLQALFEPFMQGKQTLARTEGGLGLGLALVKGIVELHGGTVRAQSEGSEKGSVFTVRLPLFSDQDVQIGPPAEAHGSTKPRQVLVVDDNSDAADSLAELVKMFGHSAEVAYDGTTALEKMRANPPDVLLCDLGLPGLTGYEIARALRMDGSNIRLIAVSGYAQPEDIARASEAGFERHIAKPIDPEAVRRLLT